MLLGNHFRVHRGDFALLVDQVADPAGVACLRIGTGAVCHSDLAVGVAQQFERKIEFLGEGGVLFDCVEADAQDDDIVFLEIGVLVTEPATFGGSTRGVGFRIEPEQNFVATKSGQRKRLAFVSQYRKIRRGIANFQHRVPPLQTERRDFGP